MTFQKTRISVAIGLSLAVLAGGVRADDVIKIEEIKRKDAVDFEKEILPIFRRSCLACHNSTEAESELILETPKHVIKGGSSGSSVDLKNPAKSMILMLASRQEESYMPPDDNDVGAKPLTPRELGLIKLWIAQGAKGTVLGKNAPVNWQPLPKGVNPIYSVAQSGDGRFAAAGRANQVFLYNLATKRPIGRLTDPTLLKSGVYKQPGVAMLDLVQAMAFSPDGRNLAVGGYRTVKIWQRPENAITRATNGVPANATVMTVSTDAKQIAVGTKDGQIATLNAADGKVIKSLKAHDAAVRGIELIDGNRAVTASEDMKIKLWDLASGKMIAETVTPSAIHSLRMVSKKSLVATAGADGVIRIWNLPVPTKKAPAKKEDKKEEKKKDDKKKDAKQKDDKAKKEEKKPEAKPAPPKPVRELKGHKGVIHDLALINADGTQILSAGQDGTARVWDVNNGKQIRSLAHGGPVVAVAAHEGAKRFATAGTNNSTKLWDSTNGKQVAELKGDFKAKYRVKELEGEVALAATHVKLNTADLDAAKKRKTAEDGNLKKAQDAKKKADEDLKKKVTAVATAKKNQDAANKKITDSKTAQTNMEKAQKAAVANVTKANAAVKTAMAGVTTAQKAVETAKAELTKVQTAIKLAGEIAKADAKKKVVLEVVQKAEGFAKADITAKQAAIAPAQKAVTDAQANVKKAMAAKTAADKNVTTAVAAVKAAEAAAKKLEPATKKANDEKAAADKAVKTAQRSVERAQQSVKKAADAIPPIDKSIADAKAHEAAQKKLLEAAKAEATKTETPFFDVAFSKDGATVATSSQLGRIHAWDAATGAAFDAFWKQGATVSHLTFDAAGNILGLTSDRSLVIWNPIPEWTLVRTIGTPMTDEFVDRVTSISYSHDGKLIATGSGEPSRSGEIKIWNAADGKLIRAIKEPHSDTVFALEFSRDGKYIASSAADRFIKVFQVADGKFVRSFEGHTHHVLGVSWSADGRTLASSGADKVVKVWDFRTGDQKRTISGFGKEVTSVRFAGATGNVVSSSGDKNVYIKNTANGSNVKSLTGAQDYVYSVSVSADGKKIIAGGQDSVLRVWSDAGASLATFEPPAVKKR